ncbi:MAG: TonB-dependent receptor [Caulobacteraceae bacterium]
MKHLKSCAGGQRIHRRRALLVAAGSISLLAAGGGARAADVVAADAADTAAPAVGEVIVTAERRETSLQKTAIAISAYDAGRLADRGINSIRDLSGQIPNFSIARANISYTTQTYALRGVGETDPIQEPVVAVYVDDVYQPRQLGSMLDFNDVQRIEVLRGPQGTLYGRNSSAGAIRVITADPGQTPHDLLSLTYGSYNDVEARGLVSGPLSETFAGSLSYLHRSRDGITEDPTLGHDVNRIDFDAVRGKLRWTPNDRLDAQTSVNVLRDRSDTRSYTPVSQPGGYEPYRSYSEVPPYQKLDQASISERVQYKLNDALKLKSITSYGGFDLNPVWYDNDGAAALIQKNLIHYNDQFITQELQLNGEFGRLNFTSGFFYLHERFFVQRDGYTRTNAVATTPPLLAAGSNYSYLRAHNFTDTDSYAVFGEGTYRITDKLSLTGGVRLTQESKRFVFDNSVINLNAQVIAPSIQGQAQHTWTAATPKASVQYQWTPTIQTYATYAEGFKSGGFDNRATTIATAQNPFNPETVDSYEGGLKSQWFDRRFQANLAIFYNQYKDLQASVFDPAFSTSVRINAGKAHTDGVELETETRLTEALGVQVSGGYLDAIYDSFKNAGGLGVNADGKTLINSPKWNASAALVYDLPVKVPGGLRLTADGNWQGAAFSNALNRPQDQYPDQAFLNASLIWTAPDPRWSVDLSSRNLLDSHKPVSTTYTPSTGIYYYNVPDPRTVLITVKFAR